MQNQPTYNSPETYSWESYLQLEQESKLRYEYYDGEIVCLAGASNRHNDICTNLTLQLAPPAHRKGCKARFLEVKVFRPDGKKYFYPDGVVTCQPLDLQTQNGVRNPAIVIEVLSDSTRARDLGIKLRQYLRLATVRHYLIVEQTECAIYHYRRQPEGGWEVVFYENMDQTISLPELDAEIAVSAIYEGISFAPPISMTEEEMGEYEVENLE
ncbi:MAG: Uma2 family endonuclease [Bacteroidia bacterium]|nr:Uma2 family endonuclease [Bacteroidia bacterium]